MEIRLIQMVSVQTRHWLDFNITLHQIFMRRGVVLVHSACFTHFRTNLISSYVAYISFLRH